MFSRPCASEQDEQLLQQNKLFNEERKKKHPSHDRPSSKFASNRKKSKKDMVDHTVLQEAVSRSSVRTAVLGRVVERCVPDPASWTKPSNAWPLQQPYGNPQPVVFPFQDFDSKSGKSLYKQYLDSVGRDTASVELSMDVSTCIGHGDSTADAATTVADVTNAADATPVAAAVKHSADASNGSTGSAISGIGALERGAQEAAEIHQENLARLSQLTPAEIQREREELMAQCDPKLLQYFRNIKQQKKKNVSNSSELRIQDKMAQRLCDTSGSRTTIEENEFKGTPGGSKDTGYVATTSEKEENKPVLKNDGEAAARGVPTDAHVSDVTKIDVKCADAMDVEEEDDETIEAQLPIPPDEAKKWAHMDKVELDKLRWTTDMPAVKPLKHKDESYVARFSFSGQLLPYDVDLDYREALHHHGQEPGRAGYSLDELFILVRSSVTQQRQLSLNTLAAILRNMALGHYHSCFQSPLLQMLLESGLVLLVRFSLDDSVAAVRVAGVGALAALLASDATEGGQTAAHPWAGILRVGVASALHAQRQVQQELNTEESELKDTELLQLDVIRALLRVDTLTRLRYIVEKLNPPPECVLQIISILIRMSSHSLTAAWKVASAPRLLSCLIEHYLPHDTSKLRTGENVDQMTCVEGVPLRHMLTLLKVLCSWGKHLSQQLMIQHDLLSRILAYVSLDPTEVAMPLSEVLKLCVEAYSVWDTLVGYNLLQAQESLLSFYPMLLRQLHFYKNKVSINEETGSNQLNFDLGANLIHMLSRTLSIAATKSMLETQLKQNKGLKVGLDDRPEEVLQAPLIGWDDMASVVQLLQTCCTKWCSQLQRGETTFSGLKLLGTTFIFLENYFRKWKDQRNYSPGKFLSEIENLYNETLSPFLQSDAFTKLLCQVKVHSALLSMLESSACEDAKNLASLNTVTLGGKVTPILLPTSPFPLLLPLSSLLCTLHRLHQSLRPDPSLAFVNHPIVVDYLQSLTQKQRLSLRSQWFTRIEAAFLANIIQVAAMKVSNYEVLYHRAALLTLPCLQKGQEYLAKCLVSEVICSESSVQDLAELSTQVNSIGLNDYEPLKSPALFQPCLSPLQLTSKLLTDLSSVAGQLVTSLFETKALKESVVISKDITFLISTNTIEHTEAMNVFDDYWPLLPLKKIMLEKIIQMAIANEKAKDGHVEKDSAAPEGSISDQSKPELIIEISRCLQLTYLCLRYRNSTVMQCTNITGWLRHLSLTFLVASDLFLDHIISSYLQGCLRELLKDGGNKKIDDKLEFSGLGNSFDWYKKLIEQYCAVSYGDPTFALMLLLPAQQFCPIAFRSLLWGDLSDALPLIRLKVSDVETFMPVSAFLEPPEKDPEMLHKYKSSIVSGFINEARTPFLWSLALHHISQEASPSVQ